MATTLVTEAALRAELAAAGRDRRTILAAVGRCPGYKAVVVLLLLLLLLWLLVAGGGGGGERVEALE